MMKFNFLLLSSALLVSRSFAFTAQRHAALALKTCAATRASTIPLNVGLALDWNTDDEALLMQQATDCAKTGLCSLENARMYLDDVIHIQSGCASGTLLGSDVCENVDSVAEVVANLREKIEQKSKQASLVNAGVNVAGVSLTVLLLSAFVSGMAATSPDMTPFTPQEWWWALRDGYLPEMMQHYFRHGGLATLDFDAETTPFALQEWIWAIKGGYANTMVDHFFRNGGLATAENFQVEVAPLTPQEWMWSLQGGYLDQLVAHNVQNGGLANAVENDVVPLTAQEWLMAAQGGYLSDISEHYYRNGGL